MICGNKSPVPLFTTLRIHIWISTVLEHFWVLIIQWQIVLNDSCFSGKLKAVTQVTSFFSIQILLVSWCLYLILLLLCKKKKKILYVRKEVQGIAEGCTGVTIDVTRQSRQVTIADNQPVETTIYQRSYWY